MTSHPLFKFFVGFTAGACAAIFPKIAAALAVADDNTVFTRSFLQWTLLFALLIGLVIMILEWNVEKEPSATFMAALGIPALLAGGLNTSAETAKYEKATETKKQLAQELSVAAGIPVRSRVEIAPIDSSKDTRDDRGSMIEWTSTAYAAATDNTPSPPVWVIGQGEERRYIVVLDSAEDIRAAKQKEDNIRRKFPSLDTEIVRAGNEYLVIDREQPLPRAEAVLKAARIKHNGLNPQLLEVP